MVAAVPADLLNVHVADTCDSESGFVQLLEASQRLMRARMACSSSPETHDSCKESRIGPEDVKDAMASAGQLLHWPEDSEFVSVCYEKRKLVAKCMRAAAAAGLERICANVDPAKGLEDGKQGDANGVALLAKAVLALEEAVAKGGLDQQRLSAASAALQYLQPLL
jgi:hypothetical protein